MDETYVKEMVVAAGMRLLRRGLVARTWGNVSQRLDKDRFCITPSGIPYEQLTVQAIVTVSMHDLGYKGEIKPSSEKGLHAAIYRSRPDAHAVVHTHQPVASAFSAARKTMITSTPETVRLIGRHVRTADYALPGTKKLARAASEALKDSQAVILANHGAVCIGRNLDEAFQVCLALEHLCETKVEEAVWSAIGSSVKRTPDLIHRVYLEQYAGGRGI